MAENIVSFERFKAAKIKKSRSYSESTDRILAEQFIRNLPTFPGSVELLPDLLEKIRAEVDLKERE